MDRLIIEGIQVTEDGKVLINTSATEADVDWLRAARLMRRAKEGDKEAAKELERMENSEMVYVREKTTETKN